MMKIKQIVVDELETNCKECIFHSKDSFGHMWCKPLQYKISGLSPFGGVPSWCPLETEKVCEWTGKIKCIGMVDEYLQYKSPHEPPHFHNVIGNLDDRQIYIYCHVCGKRIKYEEE